QVRQVISASRRTDIPMHFVAWLSGAVGRGYVDVPQPYSGQVKRVSLRPEDIHTLVLWSKDFRPLLRDVGGIRRTLAVYDQLFCHLTITGLGGTALEPIIPRWEEVAAQLPELVQLVGDPRRVSVRYDPMVHWYEGEVIHSNLPYAEPILREVSRAGIPAVRVSFATLYGKIRKRKGWRWYDPGREQRLELTANLVKLASSLGLTLYACSQSDLLSAGALPSRCIDGELLAALHPQHLPAASVKDPGQRQECGCTLSVDIGSYQMRCPNGCRYCYANPLIPAAG
ncbi:MAG: DUF1848 domain-containing protein, partial [Chloroflexi bacterium]|nr:DUF1848 domain-containing protein [Chloroflexota bacterium]